ncbi:hypothetical protein CEXT_354421 [Caerostris extrusa]|uniref:Secreted protein n=1 Tax=Caerostris extrusa TaxID=172846 RepID=A0AAV4Y2R3_CAEEX|nr:hypothetical protein CEXT_354421 [Caerostris extrusa]
MTLSPRRWNRTTLTHISHGFEAHTRPLALIWATLGLCCLFRPDERQWSGARFQPIADENQSGSIPHSGRERHGDVEHMLSLSSTYEYPFNLFF